jgi:hypothetical protein
MEDDQTHQPHTAEEAELVREVRLAILVIERAEELERSSSVAPGENMTLEKAISVLEKHGEEVWLEHVYPVRTIELPEERRFVRPEF